MILEIAVYTVAVVMSVVGLILTFVSIPGVWLIYLSTVLVAVLNRFQDLTPTVLIILFLITLISTFTDDFVRILGVKAMGGSIWGMIGALLGGLVGFLIGNIVGIILGPLIGAFLFELLFARKSFKDSLKAGIGSFIGMLVTILLKTGVNVAMIIYVVSRVIGN
jgi:uncharacterized protein